MTERFSSLSPQEKFNWWLDLCAKETESCGNSTIAIFKDGEKETDLIRQFFVEAGEEYTGDFCKKAEVVKCASENFLKKKGLNDLEVVIEEVSPKSERDSQTYKRVLVQRTRAERV